MQVGPFDRRFMLQRFGLPFLVMLNVTVFIKKSKSKVFSYKLS